eukprot:177615-Karenia_brevis.AAC.1
MLTTTYEFADTVFQLCPILVAHCETTMEAAIGDLLPWFQKPRLDDMLKGYIIKSRVRDAKKLLLAQPYSSHLLGRMVFYYVNVDSVRVDQNDWEPHRMIENDSA